MLHGVSGRECGRSPRRSVAPMTWPPRTPPRVLAIEIERLPGGRAGHEIERFLGIAVHGSGGAALVELAEHAVEMAVKRAAVFEALRCQARGQVEILHGEIRSIRIAAGIER